MELQPYKQGLEMTVQDNATTEIVAVLEGKRDEAVSDRSEVESRWLRDLQQFEGNTLDRMTKGDTDYRSAVRKSPPVVHITRTRTLSIAARIINMLVPSNERSWDIEATPIPTMIKLAEDDSPVMDAMGQPVMVPDKEAIAQPDMMPPPGMPMDQGMGPPPMAQPMNGAPMDQGPPPMDPMAQPEAEPQKPLTKADIARQEIEDSEKRARRMREHMDDQLIECRFNSEQRKTIVDGCKIGSGIIEGPVIGGNYKKTRFQLPDGQWDSEMEEEPAPQFKSIDPWNFYPLPAEHISKCEGVFIDQLMNRREIQELKLLPGFDADMIDEILREKPEHSSKYASSMVERSNITGETQTTNNRYSVWKYTGSLNRDDMEQLGIDVDEDLDVVDPIIEAWFCNTRLVKIKRHALEGAYRLPYYVWNYEESETSIFGYGVPYFMRDSDRVIQSTWHMILHNAALSAGPMLVRHKGSIEPADGTEEIAGGLKQWYFTDPEKSINDAFQMFQIDARINDLVEVHDRARQNADEELAFPLLSQGQPTEAVPTSSGMAMLMNASNVVQRRIAQSYDDEVLEPSIGALYDYNMTYLDDDEAKGDMTIRPMGATKLVVKDMQAQHLVIIADMTTNDRFAPLMKDDELLRGLLKAAEVDPDLLMKSEEEMVDPGPSEAETAELEKLKAETEEIKANAALKMRQANEPLPMPEGPAQMTPAELSEQQFQYARLSQELQIQQMKLEASALEASKSENIKLADIQAKFKLSERADETRRMIALNTNRQKQIENQRKNQIAAADAQRKEAMEGYKAGLKSEELKQKRMNMQRGFDSW